MHILQYTFENLFDRHAENFAFDLPVNNWRNDLENATISDFLTNHRIRRPDHVAYQYMHDSISWAQLDRRIDALVLALWNRGVRPGDAIAVCVNDGPVQIEVLFATARLGVARVGLNYRHSSMDIERLVSHSESKLIIVADAFAELVVGCSPELGMLSAGNGQDELGAYETALVFDAPAPQFPRTRGSDICQICYTTGSTGNPKGAVWRHSGVLNVLGFSQLDLKLNEDDVFLHCLPAAGVPSILAMWNVTLGFTTVVMPAFDPGLALDLIEKYKCTTTLFIPTMITGVCEEFDKKPRDVSSMHRIYYGSASTPPALVRRAGKVFEGIELEQVYGSTEGAGGWYTKLSHKDHQWAIENDESLLASCGQPMIHCRVRIVGENGDVLPVGEIGEISVSGDFVMDGYLKEPELTEQVLKDGWLLTGDMGRLDEKHYLYLVDRKQFMIITGGYNVYPIEVENVIAAHPSVLEVCVFGMPDDKWGEAIHAAIVPRAGKTINAEEIRDYCRGKMSKFKVPKSIEARDQLIRGATGKILKRAELDRRVQMFKAG